MLQAKLDEIGWSLKGTKAPHPEREVEALERYLDIRLPETYRKMLIRYAQEIFFDIGAVFPLDAPTSWSHNDQFQDLDFFYGFGKDGIRENIAAYVGEQIPDWLIPIGGTMAGNQICLAIDGDDKGAIYFWDHEHADGTGLYLVAPSFDDFLNMLKPDPEGNVMYD